MYTPNPITKSDLDRQVDDELRKISTAINQPLFEYIELKKLNIAPSKPRDGRIYYADGTNWDPLSLSGGNAYFVWYTGTAYRGLHETANGTNLT